MRSLPETAGFEMKQAIWVIDITVPKIVFLARFLVTAHQMQQAENNGQCKRRGGVTLLVKSATLLATETT